MRSAHCNHCGNRLRRSPEEAGLASRRRSIHAHAFIKRYLPASGNIPRNQSRGIQVARLFHWLAKPNLIRAVLRNKRIRATDRHAFPWSRGRIHRAQRTRCGTLNACKEADTPNAQAIGNKLIPGTIPSKDHWAT